MDKKSTGLFKKKSVDFTFNNEPTMGFSTASQSDVVNTDHVSTEQQRNLTTSTSDGAQQKQTSSAPLTKPLEMSFADWKRFKEALDKPKPPPPPQPRPLMSVNTIPPLMSGNIFRPMQPPPFWDNFMMPHQVPPQMQPIMRRSYQSNMRTGRNKSNAVPKTNTAKPAKETPTQASQNFASTSTSIPTATSSETTPATTTQNTTQQLKLNPTKKKKNIAFKGFNSINKANGPNQPTRWVQKPQAPPPLDAITPESHEEKQRMWKEYRNAMKPFKNREFHNAKRCVQRLSKKNPSEMEDKDRERLKRAQETVTAHKAMLTQKHAGQWTQSSNASGDGEHKDGQAKVQIFVRKPPIQYWNKSANATTPYRKDAMHPITHWGDFRAIKGGGVTPFDTNSSVNNHLNIASTNNIVANAPTHSFQTYFVQGGTI